MAPGPVGSIPTTAPTAMLGNLPRRKGLPTVGEYHGSLRKLQNTTQNFRRVYGIGCGSTRSGCSFAYLSKLLALQAVTVRSIQCTHLKKSVRGLQQWKICSSKSLMSAQPILVAKLLCTLSRPTFPSYIAYSAYDTFQHRYPSCTTQRGPNIKALTRLDGLVNNTTSLHHHG